MLVVMSVGATEEEIQVVRGHIQTEGLTPHESRGQQRVVIGVVGDVERDACAQRDLWAIAPSLN